MSESNAIDYTFPEELYTIAPLPTIVISEPWNSLSQEEVDLLTKIVQSVRLSLDAIRIIHSPTLDLSRWAEKPGRLIGFGVTISGTKPYEVITTPEVQMVLADSLAILKERDDLKKQLWVSLKQLFFAQ